MEICYKCGVRSVCKYFPLFSTFPGSVDVKSCDALKPSSEQTIEPVKPMVERQQRSIEELNRLAGLAKKLDEEEKTTLPHDKCKEFAGTCDVCGEESDSIVECKKCGKHICPDCATESIADGNIYCPTCYESI